MMNRNSWVWPVAGMWLMAVVAHATPEALQYPYVATYYVEPTVTPTVDAKIGFFVTDWNNAKVRFGDDTLRFDAELRFSTNRTDWTTRTMTGIPSGDHEFNLGKLPAGDYSLGIKVTDSAGRPSHTVWHEFRSRSAASLAVPADKVYTMTEGDFAKYGIVTETNRYSTVLVETASETSAVEAIPSGAVIPDDGYTVFAPCDADGKLRYRSWKYFKIVYGDDYDAEAVEQAAVETRAGLQSLIDEKRAAGYRKVRLLPETYRISASSPIQIPGNFTLDMNGAKLKMNGFTGSSAAIVVFTHAYDAHLVNGTLEGDYYEHDYAGSPDSSQHVMGAHMEGDCRYTTIENVTITHVTGYGAYNGLKGYDQTFAGSFPVNFTGSGCYSAGALRLADGSVDASATGRFTSVYRDISTFINGYIQVSKYLGYQGIATKSWLYTAAFYRADKSYISGEVAFQYRHVPIPKGAKYLRITVECDTLADANACSLKGQLFKMPWNCAYKNLKIELCRAVGIAPSAMRNMLFEGNEFTYSGDTLAMCAFDAEDGWDLMQDVFVRDNNFHDNPLNEFLTCAGHNFVVEHNVGKLFFYSRCNSPCVRFNNAASASFGCDTSRNRTMHGRYYGNRFEESLYLGRSSIPIDWDIVVTDDVFSVTGAELYLAPSATGRIRDCTVSNAYIQDASAIFDGVTFANCHTSMQNGRSQWNDCKFKGCNLQYSLSNDYSRCVFTDGSLFSGMTPFGWISFTDCAFTNFSANTGWWTKPYRMEISRCEVKGTNTFWKTAAYSIGRLRVHDSIFDTGAKCVFDIFDCRANNSYAVGESLDGIFAIWNCIFKSQALSETSADQSGKPIYLSEWNNVYPAGLGFVTYRVAQPAWTVRTNRDPEKVTLTTEVPVELEWLAKCPTLLAAAGGDFEVAARTATGKTGAGGAPLIAWQEYVRGTDPEDPSSNFQVSITMVNGVPKITWSPDLESKRTYRTYGSSDLGAWHFPTESADRFFKVRVSLEP